MTNPVSVTALTWWNMWWHPVTFWQFTDNKQSAWNNNHDKAGLASPAWPGRTHSLVALQWANDRYSDWRIVSWEYQWSTSAVTKSLQITFQYLISTQMFRGVFQMRANICFTFKAYNCLRDFWERLESDSWIAGTQCGACCNESKNFSRHRCSKSHCHLRSN